MGLKLTAGTRGTLKPPRRPSPPEPLPLNVCPVPELKDVLETGRLLKRVLVVKAVPPPPRPLPAEAEDVWKVAPETRLTAANSRTGRRAGGITANSKPVRQDPFRGF